MSTVSPFAEGQLAFTAGTPLPCNPHTFHNDAWYKWYKGWTAAQAAARKAAVTRTEGDYVHVPGAIWEDMIDELAQARSKRTDMDENGVHLSHDAYNLLERQAAIARSAPWKALAQAVSDLYEADRDSTYDNLEMVENWIIFNAPKEAAE